MVTIYLLIASEARNMHLPLDAHPMLERLGAKLFGA